MALIQDELSVISIEELFQKSLKIPTYQRPYTWSGDSANTLFTDILEAFRNNINEYRIGSIILHKHQDNANKDVYDIVDGQQRVTTLSILLHCCEQYCCKQNFINETFGTLSFKSIKENQNILKNNLRKLESDKDAYINYVKKGCKVVIIVTDNEQEAFQFFDSQNSRGKELDPHDLLKSYHLREMRELPEQRQFDIVKKWENMNQSVLKRFFANYLYPLTQWYKDQSGLDYSSSKIQVFKGINNSNKSNFALYHKAVNLFVENFNKSGYSQLLGVMTMNQFQLTQPLIAGYRFFYYTNHYYKLLFRIREIEGSKFFKKELFPASGYGDLYVHVLFENAMLFFADRFGIDSLTNNIIKTLYVWSYSLRLVMTAVYKETVNNYAIDGRINLNSGLHMFKRISDMQNSEEINIISLDNPSVDENKVKPVYKPVIDFIKNYFNV